MQKISLGRTGLQVSELGFGAMYLPRISPEESDRLLLRALELGIDYFDTAAAYQDSEEKLGRVLGAGRKGCVLTSRSMAYKMGPEAFQREFEQSLKRLHIDCIDFYGFHAVNQPPDLELAMGRPLEFLQQRQHAGAVRHLAITGHNPVTLTRALKTGLFALVMFPFNVIEQEPLGGLLQAARDHGVATSVMKPLAGGVIEDKEAALRFFFDHQAGVVTPGMASVDQLERNRAVFEARQPLGRAGLEQLQQSVAALGREFCRRCSYCMPCPAGVMIPFVHMIHMKCHGHPMDDDVAYTLRLGKQLQPALEKCAACGECVKKCPYGIPTPDRVRELLDMLRSVECT